MEPDHVFEDTAGVPIWTRRRTVPFVPHLVDDGAESVAGLPVSIYRAVVSITFRHLVIASYSVQSICASGTPTDLA